MLLSSLSQSTFQMNRGKVRSCFIVVAASLLIRYGYITLSSFQQVFFVESVCDDPEVIAANILV